MKYAIQKSNWEYEIKPTKTTLEGMIGIIKSFPWDDELYQYHENPNIDKMYPSLDVEEENKVNSFLCSYVGKNEFEVSFIDPKKRPKGKINKILHPFLHPGGDFHVFKECNAEKVIHLLKLWNQYSDSEFLEHLRENKIKI